ncbi:hypothetical protein [Deinococcus sp. NW-56]|uniref:hypothetical protein n=1 Tax=Deinococcus sp. NW-56 TaxID=2080419 RepID=UPI00131A4203|nr:hypothetical protein [Deinococcus sp. NW-56]
MNQFIRTPDRRALEPLSPPLLTEALIRESTLLAATWFAPGSQPSTQLCVFADALAHTFLVRLGTQIESAWDDLYPAGEIVPHHHHFGEHADLVLVLSAPRRRIAVRLRALALSLLEHHAWAGVDGFRDLLDDPAFTRGAAEPDFDAEQTVQLARYAGVRLTQPWPAEVMRQLSDLTHDVLPAPRKRELQ